MSVENRRDVLTQKLAAVVQEHLGALPESERVVGLVECIGSLVDLTAACIASLPEHKEAFLAARDRLKAAWIMAIGHRK